MAGSDVLITVPIAIRSKNSFFIEPSSIQTEEVDVPEAPSAFKTSRCS
jgi:hypothetical protein